MIIDGAAQLRLRVLRGSKAGRQREIGSGAMGRLAVDDELPRGDVAGVILEPAGGSSGTIPTLPGYLQELREITRRLGLQVWGDLQVGFAARDVESGLADTFGAA